MMEARQIEGRLRTVAVRGLLASVLASGLSAGAAANEDRVAVAATPGAIAPAFALGGTGDSTVRLADYRGEVVYVDFWASWCAPCLQSFPWMNAVAGRHRAAGLRVVAINLDRDREAARRFLADTRADFDLAFDPGGTSAAAYGLVGMPSSYVIGRDGRVVHTHVGFRRKDAPSLEAAIVHALADDGRGAPMLAAAE